MSAYTDADVQAGGDAVLEHGAYDPELATTGHLCITRDVLNAVARAIAARALRDFADNHVHFQSPARMQEDLHAKADEIEAGR